MSFESQPPLPTSLQERFPQRIRIIFLSVIVPLALLPILFIGGSVYIRARLLLAEQVNTQLNSNLQILSSEINSWVNSAQIRLDAAIRQKSMRENMDTLLASKTAQSADFQSIREAIFSELVFLNKKRGNINFNEYLVVNPQGKVIIATDEQWEGEVLSGEVKISFTDDQLSSYVAYAPAPFSTDQVMIFVHVPYLGANNQQAHIIGVLSPLQLQDILEFGSQLQPESRSYFITSQEKFFHLDLVKKELAAFDPTPSQTQTFTPLQMEYVYTNNRQSQMFSTSLHSFNNIRSLAGFVWLPDFGAGLVFEVPQNVAFQQLATLTPYTLYWLLGFIILSSIVAAIAAEWLPRPIILLTEITRQFAQGNWDIRMPEDRRDEIGMLSHSFNQMAEELSDLYRTLNSQVEEQTLELQKRGSQFEATARVARDTAAIQDMETLFNDITRLISEHFGFYHAGIFLLDDEQRFTVLQAANSEGGQRMLARGHRLAVGQAGVVGRVAATGLPRIALDVGEDRYYFDNPDMPETRSEMALPLKVKDRIIGVLDVQSTVAGAFTPEDTEALQIMADQIALAIENMLLHDESTQTIQELQTLYGTRIGESWRGLLGSREKAYHFDRIRVKPATSEQLQIIHDANHRQNQITGDSHGYKRLHLPISLRDQNLGSIILRRKSDEPDWTDEDQRLAQEVIVQISVALENARLLEESQHRAAQEELIGKATSRMRETLDIETVLKTAASELRQALDLAEVEVRMGITNITNETAVSSKGDE